MNSFQPGGSGPKKPNAALQTDGYVTPRSTWIDKQPVLEKMRISERTLQKWRSKGILPHYNIAGRIYYCEEDLQTLLENSKRTWVEKRSPRNKEEKPANPQTKTGKGKKK